jgi:hypothetical protein
VGEQVCAAVPSESGDRLPSMAVETRSSHTRLGRKDRASKRLGDRNTLGIRANTRAVALDKHLERLLRALRPPNRS